MVMVLAPTAKGMAWLARPDVTGESLTLIGALLTAVVGVTVMDETVLGTLALKPAVAGLNAGLKVPELKNNPDKSAEFGTLARARL